VANFFLINRKVFPRSQRSYGKTDMARSTRLVTLIKNIYMSNYVWVPLDRSAFRYEHRRRSTEPDYSFL